MVDILFTHPFPFPLLTNLIEGEINIVYNLTIRNKGLPHARGQIRGCYRERRLSWMKK